MADDSEIKIYIKAITLGFDEATAKMAAFKKSASAAFQSAAQELVKAQEAAAKEDLSSPRNLAFLEAQKNAKQFAIVAEKQLAKDQADAIKQNKEWDAAQQKSMEVERERVASLEKLARQFAIVSEKRLAQDQSAAIKQNKEFDETQRKAADSAKKLADSLSTTKIGYLQTTPAVQNVISSLRAMTEQFVIAGAILLGFQKIVKAAFQFAEEGAQIQRLEESGAALAQSFGVNLSDAAKAIKAASLGTITAQQAMLETNRALLLGIAGDTQTLAKLMEIAAIRGRALGLDTEVAFDRIVLGIGRLSTRILDDIGIVIQGDEAYKAYAVSIGKSVDELTEQQKRIALTNAIIEDGNKLLAATGGLVDDAASSYARFSTNITDTTNALKKNLSDGLTPVVVALDKIVFGFKELRDVQNAAQDGIIKGSKSYQDYLAIIDKINQRPIHIGTEAPELDLIAGLFAQLLPKIQAVSEAEYNAATTTKELDDAYFRLKANAEDVKKVQEALAKALSDFKSKMDDLAETSDKISFEDAAKQAYDFAKSTELGQASLDALGLQLGVLDQAFIKYRESMKKAAEDGVITAQELQKAWAPIGFANLLTLHAKLELDIQDAKDKMDAQIAELDKDWGTQLAKDRLDLGRKLSDIDQDQADRLADLQGNIQDKREAAEKDHTKRLENIEIDYQRQIRQIMQRYEMSRLHALIDLNGRALFEAEAQRDEDLANAKDNAKDKRKDEQDNYDTALEDLADYEKKQKDQIAKDEERKRRDAKDAFDRQRADAKTAYDQKKADDQANFDKTKTQLNAAYTAQRDAILKQLGLINKDNRDKLNERLQDFLDYLASSENVLKALAAGTITIKELRDQFNATGGIPFGGIPYVPPVTQPPPQSCPANQVWNPITHRCEDIIGGVGMPSQSTPTGTTNVKITLDVKGDGVLASAVRSAAYGAIMDVVKE